MKTIYRAALAATALASSTLLFAQATPPPTRSAPPLPAGVSNERFPGTMRLEVDATDVTRAIFRVRQTIPVTRTGTLTLRYPEWLPGKHAPRGAIGDMAGLTFTAGGRTLAWRRDVEDVFTFHVEVPRGTREVTATFQFLSPTRGAEGRIVATPALLNLQWEQVSLYPAGYATRNIPVQLTVALPEGWTGVAAMDGAETLSGGRIRYGVTDYETLIDSPMFAGAHYRRWDLGHGVGLNVWADEARFLAAEDNMIAAHRALVSEALLLFGARHFDRYEFLLALTEELGGIGLEHHRSSENTRETDYFTDWADNGSERGLLPHELIHSWNGKFRRPARLWTPDYSATMDGRLLWVYEGQTSYWDLVLAARSGLQTREMVLGEWARYAATYQAQPGRVWRSVEDTTLDPVMAARRPRPFPSQTRTEDYYNESSLVWLDVDTRIRELSGGARSLDDFARAFFGMRDGDWGVVTYEFDDVVETLNAVQPADWDAFLRQRIMQPNQPAPLDGITRGGYRLTWRDTANVFDAERMRESDNLDLTFSLGMVIDKDGTVTSVQWDGIAFEQGITNGTRILAVNGMGYSRERMRAAITAAAETNGNRPTPLTLLVVKDGRYRTITPGYTGGLRYPHLERVGEGPTMLDRLLSPRRPDALITP